ncbi:hypothetical protein E2C01_040230 [Portunus trituberculatus]|uniref:Uncharacterized protein n=1 Tax=Portunus trituberculatus TaxID=210409 RepID=A0A5B7FFX8_PORTR|nr:hypothetical protein [Portunus trituberculatus]
MNIQLAEGIGILQLLISGKKQWNHACLGVRGVSKRTGSNPVHDPSVGDLYHKGRRGTVEPCFGIQGVSKHTGSNPVHGPSVGWASSLGATVHRTRSSCPNEKEGRERGTGGKEVRGREQERKVAGVGGEEGCKRGKVWLQPTRFSFLSSSSSSFSSSSSSSSSS